jgi:hypothetical protein
LSALVIPRRGKGRPSAKAEAVYQDQVREFCDTILKIRPSLDFAIGSRGWCYVLEEHGLNKGDFNAAQAIINECRKDGNLPLDIAADDDARRFINLEYVDRHSPEIEMECLIAGIEEAHLNYHPVSFWDFQHHFVQMMVEKIDLRSLFEPICAEYHVPLANARGSSDINSRAEMMRRFAEHEADGKQCVLLYAGDFDPAGIRISDFLLKNIADLSAAVGWTPDRLIVDRFGLNFDFIEAHNLTWIDNLETGSGGRLDDPRHPDHRKSYVQDYLAEYGVRKVEANALVVRPAAGRRLCREAISKYIDHGRISEFRDTEKMGQLEVQKSLARIIAASRKRRRPKNTHPDMFGGTL